MLLIRRHFVQMWIGRSQIDGAQSTLYASMVRAHIILSSVWHGKWKCLTMWCKCNTTVVIHDAINDKADILHMQKIYNSFGWTHKHTSRRRTTTASTYFFVSVRMTPLSLSRSSRCAMCAAARVNKKGKEWSINLRRNDEKKRRETKRLKWHLCVVCYSLTYLYSKLHSLWLLDAVGWRNELV